MKIKKENWIYVIAVLGLIYILIIAIVFMVSSENQFILFGKIDMKAFADFGSHIAGVSTFFAFLLAFLAFHVQSKTAKTQQFETTFFNMLNHFDTIVDQIEVKEPNKASSGNSENHIRKGKQALSAIQEAFLRTINAGTITIDELWTAELWNEEITSMDMVVNRWLEVFHSNITSLPQYFRFYYTIVKFIMTDENIQNKKKYTDILQAKLSSHEMGLIFYNTFYNPSIKKQEGARKFIEWANNKEIGLFENIQRESVGDIIEFKKLCDVNFKHI